MINRIKVVFAVMVVVLGIGQIAFADEVVFTAEDNAEVCHDLVDNDGDEATDEADADCAAFFVPEVIEIPGCTDPEAINFDPEANRFDESCRYEEAPEFTLENTDEVCHDLVDNDGDETTDEADVDCASFFVPEAATSTATTTESDNSSRRRSSSRSTDSSNNSQGEVLGASTDNMCDALPYITSYLRMGQNNNVEDVKKLQIFLNDHMNLNIPVTGFFGPLTHAGVNAFQIKYKEDILQPWIDIRQHENVNTPTGYVYKTTLWKIHSLMCSQATLPKPELK
jgi:hypothetical protein